VVQISSNIAFASTAFGMFLIYGECCAPGAVVLGAAGAMATLGGGWLLSQKHITGLGLAWLAAGLFLLAPAVRAASYRMWAGLSLMCLCTGSVRLLGGADAISPILALPVTAVWAVVTIFLARYAVLGRALKRDGRSPTLPAQQS
jgi:hypothetical protein